MATAIARSVKLFVDKSLSPAAVSVHIASEARRLRDELVRSGQASPTWRTFVDGAEGRSEDAVRRTITYRFSRLSLAATWALKTAKVKSPRYRGKYQDAWVVLVNGKRWDEASEIPAGSTVIIVNPVPYARKVDVGGMKMSVPPGIIEATRQAVQRTFPSVLAERDFVLLGAGVDARAPYVLKGGGRSRRKDRAAGQQLTYPALVLSERR